MKRIDTRADRYADSEWHSGWQEQETPKRRAFESRMRRRADSALWVVMVIAAVVLLAAVLSGCTPRQISDDDVRAFTAACEARGGAASVVFNDDLTVNRVRCVARGVQ